MFYTVLCELRLIYITLVVVDDVNKLTMSNLLLLDITVFPVVYLFSKVMALFNDNWA